jgi:hypothetical protein
MHEFFSMNFFLKKKKPGQVHETEIAKVNH